MECILGLVYQILHAQIYANKGWLFDSIFQLRLIHNQTLPPPLKTHCLKFERPFSHDSNQMFARLTRSLNYD